MRTTTTLALLALTALLRWQDPQGSANGQDPKPSPPPAETGDKTGAEPRDDAAAKEVPGRPERHRFEGVYRLRHRVANGLDDPKPNRGYLVITRRHLFLSLATPGLSDEQPLVHAGVREWQEVQGGMRTTVKLDYFSDSEGIIHLMTPGKQEIRTIDVVRGGLRVVQGDRSYLEFERVE